MYSDISPNPVCSSSIDSNKGRLHADRPDIGNTRYRPVRSPRSTADAAINRPSTIGTSGCRNGGHVPSWFFRTADLWGRNVITRRAWRTYYRAHTVIRRMLPAMAPLASSAANTSCFPQRRQWRSPRSLTSTTTTSALLYTSAASCDPYGDVGSASRFGAIPRQLDRLRSDLAAGQFGSDLLAALGSLLPRPAARSGARLELLRAAACADLRSDSLPIRAVESHGPTEHP